RTRAPAAAARRRSHAGRRRSPQRHALAVIAAGAARPLPILVELDVGVGRTGCVEIADAVALAQRIAGDRSLRFAGIQAYWGNLQQMAPLEERERRAGR